MKANSANSSLRISLRDDNCIPFKFSMRPATANDVCAYLRIGTDAYPSEFYESSAAFPAKLRVFPSGCKIVNVAGEGVAFSSMPTEAAPQPARSKNIKVALEAASIGVKRPRS